MPLLIPQAALDSLVCDFCHKYLSATPIKVFPDRRIKCGRCVSQDDENGVISMNNKVAERSSFKCINQYEGCKTLLNTTEVFQHEAACESKQYLCPICNDLIPSYHLYNHFTNKHKKLVLKKAYFVVNQSNHTDLLTDFFLYRCENYLLFVKYSLEILPNGLTKVLFKFCSIRTLNVDVVLTYGKTTIEKKVNCDVFPSDDRNDLKMNIDLAANNLVVAFSLEGPESDISIQNAPIEKRLCLDVSIQKDFVEESLLLNDILLLYYFKNREIYLNPSLNQKFYGQGFLKKFNDDSESVTKVSIILGTTIKFTCSMCSLTKFSAINGEILFNKKFGKYYFICNFCKTCNNKLDLYVGASYLIENTTYFCKWMCGSHVPSYNLHKHENDCKNQILQACPVNLCEYRCKSFEITQHFKDNHPQCCTPVFHYSYNNLPFRAINRKTLVYVVSNISILIEFEPGDDTITITLTCKIVNARPRMIILDRRDRLIAFIMEKGTLNRPSKRNSLRYMCYLADPEVNP